MSTLSDVSPVKQETFELYLHRMKWSAKLAKIGRKNLWLQQWIGPKLRSHWEEELAKYLAMKEGILQTNPPLGALTLC